MGHKKLVVLSLDALQSGDLALLATMPHFSQILGKASVVKNIREIYPTLTYPIHTTILTGVHPDKHGIPHNQKPGITRDEPDWSIMGSDWYWYRENLKVKTLVDAVWEDGRTASSVLWPVTAGETRGYNIPEIWPVKVRKEDPRAVYEKAASPAAVERYYEPYISHYNWKSNGDMMYYGVDIAIDILKNEKPDFHLHHIVHLDHARHVHGDQGPAIDECLRELDIIVGRIIDATKEAGTYEDTNFVLLGDHGQIDIATLFNLNILLAERGLITLSPDGKPTDFDAYSFSAGFSTHIMLREGADETLWAKVYKTLLELKESYPQYIESVFTAQEIHKAEGLAGEMAFVVEGTLGTMFYNSLTGDTIIPSTSPKYNLYKANHGYHPDKGEKPPFLAFGPSVKEGVIIEQGDILDECPTLAALLGVTLPGMEGKPFPILK